MISLPDYQHYREFLKEFYQQEKALKTGLTYSSFSKQAGIRSPNYLKLVIDGHKNLTPKNIIRFSTALKLNDHESEFFEALVHFNQAKNHLEQTYYQGRMNRIKTRITHVSIQERTLEEYEFESLSNWLHHTLMVMTNIEGFRERPSWIKNWLFNLSSEQEINSILERLTQLKLLCRTSNGRLVQSFRHVKTKPELKRLSSRLFYEGLLGRAIQALQLTEPEKREYSTYFVGLSANQLPELKKRVREFMKSLNEWALSNSNPRQVYSFTFCAFPLTNAEERNS